ncbi:MAG: DUF6441 family protein [Bdellovibrionales bacterium]
MSARLLVALRGDLEKVMKREIKAAGRAVKTGIEESTNGLKSELRDQVSSAGLGKKLAFTWQSKVFPKSRDSINAAGFVWSKAPHIISAFNTGAVIRSHKGAYLPVPLPAAGKKAARGTKLTPSSWEKKYKQKLIFIKRKGGNNPVLVAESMRINKRGNFARSTAKKKKMTVPMFVLVPQVSLKKRLDVKSAATKWGNSISSLVTQNWIEPSDK